MPRREYQHTEDQLSFRWMTRRPFYMREIEPLAHADAWPSALAPASVKDDAPLLTPEQQENRAILMAGMKRRPSSQPSAVGSQPERKMG